MFKMVAKKSLNKESVQKFLRKHSLKLFLLAGVALIILGLLMYYLFPSLFNYGVNSRLRLKEGNTMYNNWIQSPIPANTKIYLFSIENKQQYLSGSKIKVKELGPYVYYKYRYRRIISWSENKDRVKFWEYVAYYFNEKQSNGRLDDRITVVNIPILVILTKISSALERIPFTQLISPIINNVLTSLFVTHGERLFETRTVGELINGRKVKLLDTIDAVLRPLRALGVQIPGYGSSGFAMKNNTYGYLYLKNNTKEGPFEVFTGEAESHDKFLSYATYKGKAGLEYFRGKTCNMMNGTDGSYFGQTANKSSEIYIFNAGICRSLRAQYEKDDKVRGISTYRYSFADNLFDANADNWCFCPSHVDPHKCSGILDLSACLNGAPLALSYPHFLHAPRFHKNVIGLNPNRDYHLGYLNVEPKLGLSLEGKARFQLNTKVRQLTFVPQLNAIRPTLIPYLWIEEEAEIDESMERFLKLILYPANAINYGCISLALTGCGITIFALTLMVTNRSKQKSATMEQTEPSLDKFDSTLSIVDNEELDDSVYLTEEIPDHNITGKQDVYPYSHALLELHQQLKEKVERMQVTSERMSSNNNNTNKFETISGEMNGANDSVDVNHITRIKVNTSAHSDQSSTPLPPIDDSDATHTTIVIHRKPLISSYNSNNSNKF